MLKQKLKQIAKKITLTMLAVFILMPLLSQAVHAEETSVLQCPDGFEGNGITCTAKEVDPNKRSCPDPKYTPFNAELTDQKLVCRIRGVEKFADEKTLEDIKSRTNFLLAIEDFFNTLLWPILFMIGGLLDNSLLFEGGMGERMREIWIPIRNLVNILFVIALVGIALYNILGLGDENGNFSLKSILPKLIIGIIAVNFSFIGIKVFLDAVNVITVSIFNIPDQINEEMATIIGDESQDSIVVQRFCLSFEGEKIDGNLTQQELKDKASNEHKLIAAQQLLAGSIPEGKTIAEIEKVLKDQGLEAQYNRKVAEFSSKAFCEGIKLTPAGQAYLKKYGSQNASLAMAIMLGKVVFYKDLALDVTDLSKLFTNTLFSLLLYFIYVVSFLALFIVLVARLVVLWLAIVLSPILLLAIAVPEIKDRIGFGEVQEKFVGSAIAPIGIALSLTIGWIMLTGIQGTQQLEGNAQIFSYTASRVPIVGLNTLQDLIVAIGTIGVVWLGVFTAADKSIAAGVTNFMKEQLTRAGKWIGTAPLRYTPFIPINVPGAEGKYTGAQVMQAIDDIGNNLRDRDKLSRALGMRQNASINPNDIRRDTSAADFAAMLASMNTNGDKDFKNKKFQDRMRQWFDKNGRRLSEFDSANNTNLHKPLKKFLEKPDDGDNLKALQTAIRQSGVQPFGGNATKAVARSKTPTPKTNLKGANRDAAFAKDAETPANKLAKLALSDAKATASTSRDLVNQLKDLNTKLKPGETLTVDVIKRIYPDEEFKAIISRLEMEKASNLGRDIADSDNGQQRLQKILAVVSPAATVPAASSTAATAADTAPEEATDSADQNQSS